MSAAPHLRRPTLLAIAIPGPQGARGPDGAPGRYGQIRWVDTVVDTDDVFAAGIRRQLIFTSPAQTQDFLAPPFAGKIAWSDNRIIPRPNGLGDWLDIIVNLFVVADIAGGRMVADVDVGSQLGPTGSAPYFLMKGAGEPERVTFRIGVQTLAGFLTNGAKVFLTSTVPFTVLSEAVVVLPISAGPSP